MNFTKIVKARMKEMDMNITVLAKKMGYSINYISDLLKNERRWNETTMTAACKALRLDAQFIPSADGASAERQAG